MDTEAIKRVADEMERLVKMYPDTPGILHCGRGTANGWIIRLRGALVEPPKSTKPYRNRPHP